MALTFDDGPHPRWTREVISTLRLFGARATFFVQGERLVECPEVARETIAQGHELQPHCFEHRSHHELSEAEIERDLQRALGALRDYAGVKGPALWRPPYGHIKKPGTYEIAARHGLQVVTWTLNTCDWGGHSAEAMWKAIVEKSRPAAALRPDSIVVMHDWVGPETLRLLQKLIPEVQRRGWQIEPLSPGVETPEAAFDDCR